MNEVEVEFEIVSRGHATQDISEEEIESQDCPLCFEPFDELDVTFCPCNCVFKACRFCWYRLFLSSNPVCPGCRQRYNGEQALSQLMNSIIGTIESMREAPGGGTKAFDILKMLAFFDAKLEIPVNIFLPSPGVICLLASKNLLTFSFKNRTTIRMSERVQILIRRFCDTSVVLELCMKYLENIFLVLSLFDIHENFRKSFLHVCVPHGISIWNHVVRSGVQHLSEYSTIYFETLCNRVSKIGLYKELLQLTQKSFPLISRVFGPGHISTLRTKVNFASALWGLQSKDALVVYRRVLAEACRHIGRHHWLTLHTLNDIVAVTMTTGNIEEAMRLSNEALCIALVVHGPQSVNTLIIQRNRGILYAEMKKYKESLLVLKTTYEIESRVCGALNIATLRTEECIAEILSRQGDLAGSVQIYTDVLKKLKKDPNREDQIILHCAADMAVILNNMEECEAVLILVEDEVKRLKRTCIPRDRALLMPLMHEIWRLKTESAKAYLSLRQFKQAENILDNVYKQRLQFQGEDAPETKRVFEIRKRCQEVTQTN